MQQINIKFSYLLIINTNILFEPVEFFTYH